MQTTLPPIEPPPTRARVSKSTDPQFNEFTILVDTAEQAPYSFQNIHADADRGGRLLVVAEGVNLVRQCLGRHPDSLGDYSIQGFTGRCHVERKSMEDAHGTILGFTMGDVTRRQRFEQELANLANIECAAVVVECSLGDLLLNAPEYDMGKKTGLCNRKILSRSILSYIQDFGVPWLFANDRRMAEVMTFRFLERFWRKHKPKGR